MSAIRAFLRAIAAASDDDLPRLVFADWLDENGRPERAEFIRVEVEIARTLPGNPRRGQLFERRQQLFKAHSAEWFSLFTGKVRELNTERGFITAVACDALTFLTHADAWFGTQPITRLKIDSVWSGFIPSKKCHARELFSSPHLEQVTHLDLERAQVNAAGIYWLSRNAVLTSLRELALRNNSVGDDGVRTLTQMPRLARLESLDLVSNRVSNAGARLLIDASNLPALRELRLTQNPIDHPTWTDLEQRFGRVLAG